MIEQIIQEERFYFISNDYTCTGAYIHHLVYIANIK